MVARIERKLGMYAYYIISMTTAYCLKSLSLKLLLHSSNLLTVGRMKVKLGAHLFYIISMMTTTTNSLRHSAKLLLHSSNLLNVARMEMKIGMHACNIISMTTTLFQQQQIASGNFLKIYFFTLPPLPAYLPMPRTPQVSH